MILGLDADQDLTRYAPAIRAKGISFACRYLKNLHLPEVEALSNVGIRTVMIFETAASRALSGEAAGTQDGALALKQARSINAPNAAAIYATVDHDATIHDMPTVQQYFGAFGDVLYGHFRLGGYADGTVETGLLTAQELDYCWLAGAMGWDGSRAFYDTGQADLVQGPTVHRGHSMIWAPHGIKTAMPAIQWPDLGFDYDPDVATSDDYGGFLLPVAVA